MRMNRFAARTRSTRRLGLALALTAGTMAAAAPAAFAAPVARVAPTVGLDPAGATVTVTGTGFLAPDVPTGIYVAQTAVVDGRVVAGTAKWLRATGPTSDTLLNPDGTFETTLNVTGTLDGGRVDCAVVQCAISTWMQHSNPETGTLYTTRAITFTQAAPGSPAVTVSPSGDLPREQPTELTVSGTGFDPNRANGLGFYAAYGPIVAEYWNQSAAVFGSVKRISAGARPGAGADVLNPDGSWRTTLVASPSYVRGDVTYDCRVIECGIVTFAAQGSRDRYFDTATPLDFVPLPFEITLSSTTGLNPDTANTVTARGVNAPEPFYVSRTAIVDGRVISDARSAKYLRPTGRTPDTLLNQDGSFDTAVTFEPTFTDGQTTVDCRVTQCAISTWRHQSNPTVETLWTTQAITYAARPITPPVNPPVDPPVNPPVTPPALAPRAVVFVKAQTIGRARIATIGRIRSNVDATLSAPKTVKVKIGRARYTLTVSVPRSVKAGKSANVRVKLTKKAAAALKGRTVRVSVRVKLTANGRTSTVRSSGKITAKKAKKAAKKA